MKTQKQHHYDKLQKSSSLFMQLGIVLAMLIVFVSLESYSVKNNINPSKFIPETEPVAFINTFPDFKIETPKKATGKTRKTNIDKIDKTPDNLPIETILNPTLKQTNKNKPSIDDIIEVIIPEDEPMDFFPLEQAPIFPGCEGLNKEESKLCFTKKITQFVNKNFNTDLAREINLTGKQRIFVQFVIDKDGKVTNIKTKAPHIRLEKEALKVINKLPQMKPGMQQLKPVKVRYTLPIVFEIY